MANTSDHIYYRIGAALQEQGKFPYSTPESLFEWTTKAAEAAHQDGIVVMTYATPERAAEMLWKLGYYIHHRKPAPEYACPECNEGCYSIGDNDGWIPESVYDDEGRPRDECAYCDCELTPDGLRENAQVLEFIRRASL